MNRKRVQLISLVGAAFALAGQGLAAAAPATLTGFPFTDESLTYSIMWPTGVSLGEVHLRASKTASAWRFELAIDASVPGLDIKDTYISHANADFCSADFSKQFVHGPRKGGEKETIDRAHATVTRVTTNGGGKSEFSIPDCTKDALTLLFYTRREMGQGRVPPAQQILFGGVYDSSLQYVGAETIQIGGKPAITDKVVCDLKGPASNLRFEMYFARDAARTPLLMKVPLAMGTFSMELVR